MKLMAYSIFDKKAECYLNPFFARAPGEAHRIFSDACQRKEEGNLIAMHPEDYDLYQVGSFDTLVGEMLQIDDNDKIIPPRLLVRGETLVNK